MELKKEQKEFLEELRAYGFHISDGIGDTCSGTNKEEEEAAAIELYNKWIEPS